MNFGASVKAGWKTFIAKNPLGFFEDEKGKVKLTNQMIKAEMTSLFKEAKKEPWYIVAFGHSMAVILYGLMFSYAWAGRISLFLIHCIISLPVLWLLRLVTSFFKKETKE